MLTLTNDVAKYGPWAGKILTCAESAGLVYAIDTNGVATPYNLGLGAPEDVRLIPSGQTLYVAVTEGQVLKVTQNNFANYIGDILLVHEGVICGTAGLDMVHWDGAHFITRHIDISGSLEHAVFAPFEID